MTYGGKEPLLEYLGFSGYISANAIGYRRNDWNGNMSETYCQQASNAVTPRFSVSFSADRAIQP